MLAALRREEQRGGPACPRPAMPARRAGTTFLSASVVVLPFTMPRGLTSAQIEDILYDDNVTELGDRDLSEDTDEDDSDYIQSDKGSDEHDMSLLLLTPGGSGKGMV